jgi:hypothetical protein
VQRLFSTFPEGWPGTGLAFLRAVAAVATLQHALPAVLATNVAAPVVLQLFAASSATCLLAGLWTPVAGVILAMAELSLAFVHPPDPSNHMLIGTIGAALAMLGPGAWSVDARLFGRKRIQIPQR